MRHVLNFLTAIILLGMIFSGQNSFPVTVHAGSVESPSTQSIQASLRFYGNGRNDIDRVKIRVDPPTSANVGGNFTIEFWLKALPGANASSTCTEGGVNWIYGNIIVDRDIYGDGDYGDFGVSLAGGRIAFGVARGSSEQTICSGVRVDDGNWHHIALTRNATTGIMRIFIDGNLSRQGTGPTGNIAYRNGRSTSYPNSDPFLVLGAEKHDAGPEYPSFNGWLDEFRLSTVERYTANFTPPATPFSPDAQTAVLYHFDEQASGPCTGQVLDASTNGTHGACRYGGSPSAGPVYSSDTPFSTASTLGKTSPSNGATGQPTTLTLRWTPIPNATAYQYCYSSAASCTEWRSNGTSTEVSLQVAPNYTYYWQVRANVNGAWVEADGGTWWSFTTQDTPVYPWPSYTPPAQPTFSDVPASSGYWHWVERLVNAGITGGCGNQRYCPNQAVTRAQMAIFLLRGRYGANYAPPAVSSSPFSDVPTTSVYAPWIVQLANEEITVGCGPGLYCPNQPVTRAQMAIFLLRARHGPTYSPPAISSSPFTDVPLNSYYAPWIAQLASEGITTGCGPNTYCPSASITRAQMAVFLVRAFVHPYDGGNAVACNPATLPIINAPFFNGTIPFGQTAIAWFGQVGPNQNYADIRIGYNQNHLYVYVSSFDRWLWYDETPTTETLTEWDAITLLLDTSSNTSSLAPTSWRFVAQLANGPSPERRAVYQGTPQGWQSVSVPFEALPGWRGNALNNNDDGDRGWAMGFTIPFSSLGLSGAPTQGTTWRLAVLLHDRDGLNGPILPIQAWPSNAISQTQTSCWGFLRFGLPTYTALLPPTGQTVIYRPTQSSPLVPDADVGGTIENQCPGDEQHIWYEWGNRNAGAASSINIQNQSDIADWPCFSKYYLTFPLTDIPPNKVIVSATLTLHQFGNSGGPGQARPSWIQVLIADRDWQENTITWNNAPMALENVGGAWVNPITDFPDWPGVPRTWDVSYAVAKAYQQGQPLRLILYSADSDYHSGKYFVSSDTGDWNAAGRPRLTVQWADPPTAAPSQEWSQHAHDAQHTSYTPQVVPYPWRWRWAWNGPNATGGVAKVTTSGNVPRNVQPVTGGGRVYIAAGVDGVFALREDTGAQVWQQNNLGDVRSTVGYDHQTQAVFVVSSNGRLYKLDAATGNILGQFNTGQSSSLPLPPAILPDRVLFSMGNSVYAINKQTLTPIWTYNAGNTVAVPPAYSASRNLVIVATEPDLNVHAINNQTGQAAWVRRPVPSSRNFSDPTEYQFGWPVIADSAGYVLIKVRLDWGTLWYTWPQTNAEMRQFLTNNPNQQALFVLDLDDGTVPYIANVGNGGYGDTEYMPMGPQPVVKTLENGKQVVYTIIRATHVYDTRWDSHFGEMMLDNSTVSNLQGGDVRFIAFDWPPGDPNPFLITDEQPNVSMAGDYLFGGHWEAGFALRILDRSESRGSFSNRITTQRLATIAVSQELTSCSFSASHYCSANLYHTRPYDFGFYIYYQQGLVYDQYWTGYATWVVSNENLYFLSADGALVALTSGNPLTSNEQPPIVQTTTTPPMMVGDQALSLEAPPEISVEQAQDWAGQRATVVGKIAYIANNGKHVLLAFAKPHLGTFKVIIRRADWTNFAQPPDVLYQPGMTVRVTGTLQWYQGDPVIYVSQPEQIEASEPPPRETITAP